MFAPSAKKNQLPLLTLENESKSNKEVKEVDVKKKRFTLTIILIGSIGLSLLFWCYRSFKTKKFIFSLPTFPVTQTNNTIFPSPELKKFLSQNHQITSLYIKVTNPDAQYVYGQPFSGTFQLDQVVSRLTTPSDFPLPEGLVYKEILISNEYFVSIVTPGRNFFLFLSSPDLSLIKSELPQIVSQSYWSVFGN